MKDEVGLSWHRQKGWLLRTPMRVPDSALVKMCNHALESQIARYKKMPPTHPDKKLLHFAIGELFKLRVTQIIVKGDDAQT